MKTMRYILFIILVFIPAGVTSVYADEAREIIRKANDRDDGTTEISISKLSTFRYTKKGNKIVPAEKPRVKVMEGVRKDYGPNEKDKKNITIVKEPAGERGIGFLQYDYEEQGKDTDQWMYLSAMNKVKRIISGNENEPKTGSFFGSEINYEDLEKHHLDDYVYKVLGEETYQKRSCWVIESVPTPQHARKSNYSKTYQWIDKERYTALKLILFSRSGKRVKRINMNKYEKINDIWIARQMLVNNLETRRLTIFTIESVAINIPVEDNFLTQRSLTDGAFREGILNKLRAHF